MRYKNGTEVRLHDRIRISNGEFAVVVLSVDTNEYSKEYPQEDWTSIKDGVLVRTDAGALVQFDQLNAYLIEPA